MKRNGLNDLLVIVLFLILLIVFFWKSITLQGVFITGDLSASDIMDQNYPMRNFLSQSLKNGYFPLWNPYVFCGFPSFAEGQGGFFYPLNLLLFYLLPAYLAYNYSVILTFFLAGLFTYIYARAIKLSRFSSLLAGVIFIFSGFFVSRLKHINMINSACWLPLLFFLIEKYFQTKKIRYVILSGIVWGMQILAGHFEIAYYSMLGVGCYFLFKLYTVYKKEKKARIIPKNFAIFILVVLIGVSLSAVQMIPSYEYSKYSIRTEGLSYEETTMWTFYPEGLITFLLPYYYGDPAKATYQQRRGIFWENCAYVGLLPLLLAFISLFSLFKKYKLHRNKQTIFSIEIRQYIIFFSCLILLSLLTVMKRSFFLFKIFWLFLPGFKFFRFQQRLLLFTEFSLVILAAIGFEFVVQKLRKAEINVFRSVVFLIIVTDLFIFGIKHNPTISPEEWFSKPETVNFLEKDKSQYRIYSFGHFYTWPVAYRLAQGWKGDLTPYLGHRKVLPENFNMVYNISSAGGYTSLFLRRFSQLESILWKNSSLFQDGSAILSSQAIKILSLLNVKYIPTIWRLQNDRLEMKMESEFYPEMPKVKVYENRQFMPRAYIVPQARILSSEKEVLGMLAWEKFNPLKEALIEEKINHGSQSTEGSNVEIIRYSPLEVVVKTSLTNDGFLVLSDTYYPGWKVFINGKEGKILQANYIMRTVPLDKGDYEVKFVYAPQSFKIGLIITFVALGLVFLFSLRKLVFSRNK